jgi:Fe-S-cluster containining protein
MSQQTPPRDDAPPPPPPPAPRPARVPPEDLEGGLRFLHLVDMETKARVAELSATLNAVVETLVGSGQLPFETYEKRKRLTVLRENERAQGEAGVMVANIPDKYALGDLPQIDCAARIPLCRARCCAFTFPLSVQDLDERVVRWTYSAPYKIAQREDGYCVHNQGAGQCGVYAQRPGVCRTYDCRNDKRVWIDFEKRIPAP